MKNKIVWNNAYTVIQIPKMTLLPWAMLKNQDKGHELGLNAKRYHEFLANFFHSRNRTVTRARRKVTAILTSKWGVLMADEFRFHAIMIFILHW